QRELGSRGKRRLAFDEQSSASDPSRSAFEMMPFGSAVLHPNGQRHPRLTSRVLRALGFAIGQNLVDDEVPRKTAQRLAADSQQRDHLTRGIQIQGLAFVSIAGTDGQFHGRTRRYFP